MKTAFYIILLAIACLACKKDTKRQDNADPAITKVVAFRVYSGSNESVGFNVDLTSDSTLVKKVDIFLVPSALRWTVNNPKTGHYVMYDHVGDYQQGAQYYFIFELISGEKVTSDVYTLP